MTNTVFNRATGAFFGFSLENLERHVPFDPATHVAITLPVAPNPRTERWDGAAGIRPATPQEIADFDAANAPDTALEDLVTLEIGTPAEQAAARARLQARPRPVVAQP